MTQEQLDTLLAKFEADESLMTAIKQAKSTQAIVEIAKSRGFDIELQDLYDNAHMVTPDDLAVLELTPEELETVAGGRKKKGTTENPWTTYEKRRCKTCSSIDPNPTSNPLPKPESILDV